ncbi:MAG: hypothetical protein H6644_03455 [Caldilineaceae bacterium]|nr:hypothetical protein [Caldilineaceae bacterium]
MSGSDLRIANLENCDLKQADLAGQTCAQAQINATLSIAGSQSQRCGSGAQPALGCSVRWDNPIWPEIRSGPGRGLAHRYCLM